MELFDILVSWLNEEVLVFAPGSTKSPILVGRLKHDNGWCVETSAGRIEKIEVPETELLNIAPMYISSARRGEVRGGQGVKNQIFTSHFKRSAFRA